MISVLIVEDNRINQIVASRMLVGLGIEVDLASDGIEGVNAVKAKKYDLVFMDCQMPKMDGYTAVVEIRKLQNSGEINKLPVVALTAHSMPGDRQKCIDAGMDDYLSKPVSEQGFADMLRKWVGDFSAAAPSNVMQKYRFKYIDAEEVQKLFEMMGEGFFDLMSVYFSSMNDLVGDLKNAILSSNYTGIFSAAHTIKSPSRQVGSVEVAAKAAEIEALAKDEGDMEEIEMKFAILREQLFVANKELMKYMESNRAECA